MEASEILINKITELLRIMGFDAQVYERMEEGRRVYNIKTRDAQLLIGKQGANLEALQHVVRLLVRSELPEESFRFALDIDDYKDKRVIYLKDLARKAAHQARQSGRAVGLPPMPSHERKAVHDYLSLFSDIDSSSDGVEPNRRIVIRHSKDKPKSDDPFTFLENL